MCCATPSVLYFFSAQCAAFLCCLSNASHLMIHVLCSKICDAYFELHTLRCKYSLIFLLHVLCCILYDAPLMQRIFHFALSSAHFVGAILNVVFVLLILCCILFATNIYQYFSFLCKCPAYFAAYFQTEPEHTL